MTEASKPYGANPDQGEFWNGPSGQFWVKQDAAMSERLTKITELLFTPEALSDGQKVLDIGCGAGATVFRAASLVGAKGWVTGLDISQPLLSLAEQKSSNLPNIDLIQADAQTYAFAAKTYDVVQSRFGMMFFENPIAAFENIRSAMVPGGALQFVCWASFEQNEFFNSPVNVVCQVANLEYDMPTNAPGPMAFSDYQYLTDILLKAGFQNISITPKETSLTTRDSVEQDATLLMQIGPAARLIKTAELTDNDYTRIYQALCALSRSNQGQGEIRYDATVYVVTASA